MDSRSLDFVDAVLQKTNGEGVDVVLNSLAGEFIPASLKLLKPFGRFLEVGKRDIYENMQLGLYPFHNNLSYFAIDLGQVKDENPLEFEELFEDLMLRFACGKLTPSPTAVMPINEISKGFNRMAKAEHIGKIVISIGDEDDDDPLEKHRGSSKKMAHQGIEREKGLEVFNRLISSDETPPYVMIMKTSQEGSEKKKNPLSVIGESQLQRKVDTPFCEPTCTEEAILVEIWQRTLGITPIGINDNFFELGGDSINAILIQFEISKKFKVKLPTTVLFDYSTVKDLAALLH
jgi:acyl carrier protein